MSDEFVFCYKVESVDNSKGKVESNFFLEKNNSTFNFFGVARSFQQGLSSQGFSKGVRGVQ